jgi:hypothetical protein
MICLLLTASGARPVVNSRIDSFSRLNGAKSGDPPHEMEGDRKILLVFVTFSIWPPSIFAPSKRKPISPFHTGVREDADLPHRQIRSTPAPDRRHRLYELLVFFVSGTGSAPLCQVRAGALFLLLQPWPDSSAMAEVNHTLLMYYLPPP